MNATFSSALAALHRLRSTAIATSAVVGLAAIAWLGVLERGEAPSRAVDYTLFGAVFGWALPLFAYVAVGTAVRHSRVESALFPIARAGGDRRAAVLGLFVATAGTVAVFASVAVAVGVFFARGRVDAASLAEVAVSAPVALLGGAAYVSFFLLGATFGERGGGRAAALFLDWVLGTGHTFAAVAWPRAHLVSLIGGEAVFELRASASAASLYALLLVHLGITLWRLPR